jgi:hypothetical protein
MLDILEDYTFSQGYDYCRIDGNTTYDEREDRIQAYNAKDSEKFIFLLSTRAGGLGINLQTADVVIIFDSDWNPQADLQAQDRAHRIGQTKTVQVFRLVTEDTVEVKVVERAQQKLKLDAMVVQQGRLADQEKKLSKNDLLDTLRFGADKVFRSKDADITDDDIDQILETGRKRTEELNASLKTAEKGDLYDFSLDGGLSSQMFEGKDYRDTANQAPVKPIFDGFYIDAGKRERKVIVNYSEAGTQREDGMMPKPRDRPKIPRHLRLPKMDEWQFYDRQRLHELSGIEAHEWEDMIDSGTVPPGGQISKCKVLPAELHAEKLALIKAGFSTWTKVHFNAFIRASAKKGRHNYEAMAKESGRPVDQCEAYAKTFWKEGGRHFDFVDYDRYVKTVEKGERKIEEVKRLTAATSKLLSMFADPWNDLTFKHAGTSGRILTAAEDKALLCLANEYGYGNWGKVRNALRRSDEFRFNFFLTGLPADQLGKRCEHLMRAAERELKEMLGKESMKDVLMEDQRASRAAIWAGVNRDDLHAPPPPSAPAPPPTAVSSSSPAANTPSSSTPGVGDKLQDAPSPAASDASDVGVSALAAEKAVKGAIEVAAAVPPRSISRPQVMDPRLLFHVKEGDTSASASSNANTNASGAVSEGKEDGAMDVEGGSGSDELAPAPRRRFFPKTEKELARRKVLFKDMLGHLVEEGTRLASIKVSYEQRAAARLNGPSSFEDALPASSLSAGSRMSGPDGMMVPGHNVAVAHAMAAHSSTTHEMSSGNGGNGSGSGGTAIADTGADWQVKARRRRKGPGTALKPVPEEAIPDLLRTLIKGSKDGMARVVEEFVSQHPTISKRQTEMKIQELCVKEKRTGDTIKCWHVKPEFEYYVSSGPKPKADADAAPDVAADAAPDAAPDVSADVAPDAAPDVAADAAPDAAPDVAADAALDAAPDAAADAAPDAAPDAAADTTVEA